MKLHLGCGKKIIKDFINVDIREFDGVDVVSDITNLKNFNPNSISLIYASHVLEHISRREYVTVLRHWYDLLEPGGVLRISVPDIESVFEHYSEHKNLEILRGFIWGGQTYDQNYHYCGWDFNTIYDDLSKIGFEDIKRYDWRNTEHSHIDDYSQCYLPHMDKNNGKLMSLNIECVKTLNNKLSNHNMNAQNEIDSL